MTVILLANNQVCVTVKTTDSMPAYIYRFSLSLPAISASFLFELNIHNVLVVTSNIERLLKIT